MKRRGFLGLLFVAPFAKAIAAVRPKRPYNHLVFLQPPGGSMADYKNSDIQQFFLRRMGEFERSWKENCTVDKVLEWY